MIIEIQIDSIPEVCGGYAVGRNGITKIEAYEENGLHCGIPYVRIWKGEEVVAEFCKHNIVGVYYGAEQ